MHNTYIGGRFQRTKITRKASDAAENLQLYRVVRLFHPRSSCTMHISADVQRITLNVSSCIMISGGRTKQLDIIAGFLPHHWLLEWFSQFHSYGTYSVLSCSHSIISSCSVLLPEIIMHNAFNVNMIWLISLTISVYCQYMRRAWRTRVEELNNTL